MIENMFASTTRTRVSKWILVGSILALVGILAIGFNGILGMNQLRALVADGFNYSFVEARDSMELRQNLLQMRNRMQQIALLDDPERIAQLTIEINQLLISHKVQQAHMVSLVE